MKIDQLKFYEVIDSRGNPTIACKIFSGKFSSISMVPSGASTGSKEAQEIRDNDKKRFLGKGLKEVIKKESVDFIILAGFMRILGSDFVKNFPNKIINIHPSLLPKYPGLNTHKKVLENKDKEHGLRFTS